MSAANGEVFAKPSTEKNIPELNSETTEPITVPFHEVSTVNVPLSTISLGLGEGSADTKLKSLSFAEGLTNTKSMSAILAKVSIFDGPKEQVLYTSSSSKGHFSFSVNEVPKIPIPSPTVAAGSVVSSTTQEPSSWSLTQVPTFAEYSTKTERVPKARLVRTEPCSL